MTGWISKITTWCYMPLLKLWFTISLVCIFKNKYCKFDNKKRRPTWLNCIVVSLYNFGPTSETPPFEGMIVRCKVQGLSSCSCSRTACSCSIVSKVRRRKGCCCTEWCGVALLIIFNTLFFTFQKSYYHLFQSLGGTQGITCRSKLFFPQLATMAVFLVFCYISFVCVSLSCIEDGVSIVCYTFYKLSIRSSCWRIIRIKSSAIHGTGVLQLPHSFICSSVPWAY